MSAAVIVTAAFAGLCFLFAAASLLADYLAAHRRTDLPKSLGHERVGVDRRNTQLEKSKVEEAA